MPMPDDIFEKYSGEKFPESREKKIESPAEARGRVEVGIGKGETEQRRLREEAERGAREKKIKDVTERAPELSSEQREQKINEVTKIVEEKGLALTLKAAGETGDLTILEGVITSLARNKGRIPEEIITAAANLNDPYILDITVDTLRYLGNQNEQL